MGAGHRALLFVCEGERVFFCSRRAFVLGASVRVAFVTGALVWGAYVLHSHTVPYEPAGIIDTMVIGWRSKNVMK